MCPLCAVTGLTTWLLAGGLGGGCAATVAIYQRKQKALPPGHQHEQRIEKARVEKRQRFGDYLFK
jgi:hypothetical protein